MKKIKVYTLTHEGAPPKCIGTMKADVGESLADLRVRLEDKKVLNFPFQFWDPQECCRVAISLESLNDVEDSVFMIPALDEEVQNFGCIRQTAADREEFRDSRQSNDVEGDQNGASKKPRCTDREEICEGEVPDHVDLLVPEFPMEDAGAYDEISAHPPTSSRVSDSSHELLLKSVNLSPEIMAVYTEGEQKLRKFLKDVCLEDHEWGLKSYDNHSKAVVVLHCMECKKDFGGTDGQHSKDRVSNLFSNFRKSHIMSNQHIRAWCLRKGVDWCNHPQSLSKGKKTVILTEEDHRRLVLEGVEILNSVNDSLDPLQKTFELIGGDPHTTNLKSFWWKTKCITCHDIYSLCPPKKNLEANLRNHAGGSKHAEKMLQVANARKTPATSGRRGRPAKSVGDSSHSNQRQLHSFFNHAVDSGQVRNSTSIDRSFCKTLMCWGFRGPSVIYNRKMYEVESLLFDMKPGGSWFPEPWLQNVVVVDGECVQIYGTFRHISCLRVSMTNQPWQNLTCSECANIPNETDFRLRVVREDGSLEKRGTRGTGGGRRIGYLSLPELTMHSRSVSKKWRLERMYHWAAKLRIVQLKVKRPTLKEQALAASNEHNVYKFCGDILRAHRSGALGGRPALWDLMRDVAANLNRRKQGFRFSENSKALALSMKVYGGRRMCDLFALNYAGPSFSAVKRDSKKGVQHIPGEHGEIFSVVADIYRDAKHAHGITGPVPVILAEDETKVRSRVSYEQRFDTLAGFCGPKENHICISDYKPCVGTGEGGYNTIVESFRGDKVGGFARVVIVSPLHEKLPRLVLCVSCTCNSFNSQWVRNQWCRIEQLWEEHCKLDVGPIIGHASDGDSRRRQLMLADYKSSEGQRLEVDWAGWMFTAKLDCHGNAIGLHDQDFIHNGKKLINPIDSPVRTPQLGADMVTLTHLGLVYNKFTCDQHGLKLEDTNRKDRQNWASAQRICQQKTRDCLAALRMSKEVHQERTLGTELYLQICSNYIDMFLSPVLDLRSRVVLASKVSFFFRLWKLWFQFGNHAVGGNSKKLTVAANFVSQQCFLDVQMSCHYVVLLICHFRDKYRHLPVPLHLTGSDACEIFFSKIGGMEGHERAYDFHQLVSTANTLNRLSAMEYKDNGLKFGRVHNKMKNVWAELHPLKPNEVECNLADYSLLATTHDVTVALQEGLKLAQSMLQDLNMAPPVECVDKTWFLTPWSLEKLDPHSFAYVPSSVPVSGEDGDAEVLRHGLEANITDEGGEVANCTESVDGEEENLEDCVTTVAEVQSETQDAISEMLSSEEPQVRTALPAEKRDTTTASSSVNAAVKRKRGRPAKNLQATCVLNGVDRGMWCIGRVQKMRRKVGSRWGNCVNPIDLQNRDVQKGKKAGSVSPSFMVYLSYFRKVPGFYKFKYDHSDSIWVDIDSIICTVTMSFNAENDVFELDPTDAESLNEFIEKSN